MWRRIKPTRLFLILILIVILILYSTVAYFLSKRNIWNTEYGSGNTAGNLYNNGLFCEQNGKIYFSNSYDSGKLYEMDSDGSRIHKLNNDSVSYINVAGNYIYYAKNNSFNQGTQTLFRTNAQGLCRVTIRGKNLRILNNDLCGVVSLGNSKVIFQHYDSDSTNTSLKSVNLDGSREEDICDSPINPSCIVDGVMYYNQTKGNFNLISYNIKSEKKEILSTDSFWKPIIEDDYVYFLDINNNSLWRMNLTTKKRQNLGTGRVDTFNVYNHYIYYQTKDKEHPSFCRMKIDGTEVETIIAGSFCNINVTSNFIFFNQISNDTPIYMMPTNGDTNVTRFDDAELAVESD